MFFKRKNKKEMPKKEAHGLLDDVILEHRRKKAEGEPYDPFWVKQMTFEEFQEAHRQGKVFTLG